MFQGIIMTISRRYREQRDSLNANILKTKQRICSRPIHKRLKEYSMSKKKIFSILDSETDPGPPKKIFIDSEEDMGPPAEAIECPGLTLDELVVRTKVQKTDIKYYHSHGLLPEPIGYGNVTYWPFETPEILKLVHGERLRGKSIKQIRADMFPRKNRNSKKSFPVHVQPLWHSDRVINSKRQKFDATYKGGAYDFLDQIRIFRPLKPETRKLDVVLHIPIRLNVTGGNKSKRDSDIDCLEKNLIMFDQMSGFDADLVVSVNGFIDNELIPDVKYLEHINNTHIGPFYIKVFQRPNWGYQWGGFYDVWQKYRNSKCGFFSTLECDCYLLKDWFSICQSKIQDYGFLGMPPKSDLGGRTEMYFFAGRIWRNAGDEQIGKSGTDYRQVMTHTRGGFYYCQRFMLERLDNAYGCFTESMGCDLAIDGIAMGELGFASKVGQLGIKFIDVDHVVLCSEEYFGWPKDLILL
jgi:hypothetical protein